MTEFTEYRVVHELGEGFEKPELFTDLWKAQDYIEALKPVYAKEGMPEKHAGLSIESRTTITTRTDWETVNE